MEEKLKSLDMWLFQRVLRVSWLDRQSNEIALVMANTHRKVINVITKQQMSFLVIYKEKRSKKI